MPFNFSFVVLLLSQGLVDSMKIPKRFTLSTLLLLMLVVASVFGYAQWRKQWMLAEVAILNDKSLGIWHFDDSPPVCISNSWFWPTVNEQAAVVIARGEYKNTYSIHGKPLSNAEAKAYFQTMANRLHRIGVEDVSFVLVSKCNRFGNPPFVFTATFTSHLKALDE